ncbi:phosphoglycerate kinase [Candidatus Pacearchaeota archaeon]|nr:phosphoglycerate kinase [Candidatus Pacearchaeota archaeon]
MKTLSDFNLKNKTVLLRTDLNSDVVNNKLLPSERIKKSVKTILELKKKKAKVVILAHQGRPKESDFISLKQHAKLLNKYVKVKFVKNIIGKKAEKEIKNLKSGEILLLENIRFLKDEFNPGKNKIIKKLIPLLDFYVNDAFSICHRKQTSITSFPKYLPHCAGRLLEQEVKALKKIKIKNCLYILGGAKPEDNIKLLKGNKVLACGLFGQLCTIAKGKNFGAQNRYLKNKLYLIKKLKKKLKNVLTPVDFAVKVNKKRKELLLKEFPSKYEIFDIGKKTIKEYIAEIKKAKAIYMKGPAGFCADKKFCKGTKAILNAITKHKRFSLIGGGHLNDAIKTNKNKFNHISLSGGALLRYIAGEKLPGLEVLK